MKIDKVTYEVDLSDGDKRPIYVWEAPVRVWHWLMVITMFTMIVTGYLIGRPLEANLGNTWATFQFADIRMIHFIAGICFTGLFVYRIFWAFMGNRYAHQIFLPPFWSFKFLKASGIRLCTTCSSRRRLRSMRRITRSLLPPCSASSCSAPSASSSRALHSMDSLTAPALAGTS